MSPSNHNWDKYISRIIQLRALFQMKKISYHRTLVSASSKFHSVDKNPWIVDMVCPLPENVFLFVCSMWVSVHMLLCVHLGDRSVVNSVVVIPLPVSPDGTEPNQDAPPLWQSGTHTHGQCLLSSNIWATWGHPHCLLKSCRHISALSVQGTQITVCKYRWGRWTRTGWTWQPHLTVCSSEHRRSEHTWGTWRAGHTANRALAPLGNKMRKTEGVGEEGGTLRQRDAQRSFTLFCSFSTWLSDRRMHRMWRETTFHWRGCSDERLYLNDTGESFFSACGCMHLYSGNFAATV